MLISKNENQDLHKILFGDRENYYKWATYFYEGFVTPYSEADGTIAGVMTPNLVRIDDDFKERFFQWLESKGIRINSQETMKLS